MSLFRIAPGQEHLFPASFTKASVLATKVLRSRLHTDTFCELFVMKDNSFHIDKEQLKAVLAKNEIFTVDKIRGLQYMNARACTIREFDPFKIFFNVGLLLEMMDREAEEAAIAAKPIADWPSLLTTPTFWTDATAKQLNTAHVNVEFNSLVFIAQASSVVAEAKAAREEAREAREAKKEAARLKREEARLRKEEEEEEEEGGEGKGNAPSTRAGDKRKATDLDTPAVADVAAAPPHKQLRKEAPAPSTMTVTQKNTLMLTILLVHVTEHLLNHGLSTALSHGNAPRKKFKPDDPAYFTDVGHLMERHLYGYCIQHTYSDLWPAAFAVDEVLGSVQQANCLQYILQPVPAFLALLDDPHSVGEITQQDIALVPTSSTEFTQATKGIKVGRPSTSWQLMAGIVQDESSSTHSHSSSSDVSDEDAAGVSSAATSAYFRGKA